MTRVLALAVALALATPGLLVAQIQESPDTIIYGRRAPRWAGQITAFSTNALLGGLTAGVLQELRGGSFKDGFTRGALGGAFVYTGKRMASRRFEGAGLLGREVAALGSSVVRNAGEARPMFDRLVFPIGPLRLQVSPRTGRLDASLDVIGAAWLAWAIAEPELDLAVRASLSGGAPIFRTRNKVIVTSANRLHGGGFTPAGVVLQSYVPAWGSVLLDRVLAHERVHVLQEDQLLHTWLEPGEEWLLSKLPYGQRIARRIDINVSTELLSLLAPLFSSHGSRPWELEAIYLSR